MPSGWTLEDENGRLKRMLADAMLDNAALKDLLGKAVRPAARREAVAYLRQAFEMSERRACRVIGGDRTSVRYRGVRPDDEAGAAALPRGAADGAATRRAQAGNRHQAANGDAGGP